MHETKKPFRPPTTRARRRAKGPIVCETCGSTWFTEMMYNQYSDIAYGSGTGGDNRVISMTPQTVRVCLCGRPFRPNVVGFRGRAATAELTSFNTSLDGAYAFQMMLTKAAKVSPTAPALTMQKLSETFAALTDLPALIEPLATVEALEELRKQVQYYTLQNGLGAPVTSEAANEGGSEPQVPIRKTIVPSEGAAATEQAETKPAEAPAHHPNSREGKAARIAAQLASEGKSGA